MLTPISPSFGKPRSNTPSWSRVRSNSVGALYPINAIRYRRICRPNPQLAKLEKVTEEYFDNTFDLNVRGTLFTEKKPLPCFNENGSIFLNGSIACIKELPAFGVHSASKAAVRSFARTWLLELKERGILSPGTIDTPILDALGADAKEFFESKIPCGTMERPEEIATAPLAPRPWNKGALSKSETHRRRRCRS